MLGAQNKPPEQMLRRGLSFAMPDLVGWGCASGACDRSCFVLWITDAFSVRQQVWQRIALLRVTCELLA